MDALGGAAAILDQLGTAGGILQLRMFDAWKDAVMQRRTMLKLMGIMPAVTTLPSVAESARRSRSGKPTPDNVRDLEQLADRYQTLYHSTAPAALMTPVLQGRRPRRKRDPHLNRPDRLSVAPKGEPTQRPLPDYAERGAARSRAVAVVEEPATVHWATQ